MTTNETMESVVALVAEGVAQGLTLVQARFRAVAIRNAELASQEAFAASASATDHRGADRASIAHGSAADAWRAVSDRWICAIAAHSIAMHRSARDYYENVSEAAANAAARVA